jgi:hypothetical protein
MLVACYALPAILPPAALILWAVALALGKVPAHERATLLLLILGMLGLIAAAFPRADMMHLAFVAAVPYVLAGVGLSRCLPARWGGGLAVASVILAMIFAGNYFKRWAESSPLASPVGGLRIAAAQLPDVERLLANVHPNDSLFVYPYMPIHYFLTQAKNPARVDFFSPAMMTRREGTEALEELQARPPRWLLYLKLSREEYERVFPHGSSLDFRYEDLEAWLEKHYEPAGNPSVTVSGYRLWRQVPMAVSAARN